MCRLLGDSVYDIPPSQRQNSASYSFIRVGQEGRNFEKERKRYISLKENDGSGWCYY